LTAASRARAIGDPMLEEDSMTLPRRRSGPSPALVIFVSAAIAIIVFLGILALRVPAGIPISDYPSQIAAQLESAWSSFFPPAPVTVQGEHTFDLYTIVFAVAAVIFLFVEFLIVLTVIRFRRKPGQDELPPQVHGNNLLEIGWTLIPTLIVGVLFLLSWQTLNYVDATGAAPQETRIRAIGQRFQWTFQYLSADGQQVLFTQVAPEMDVPAGTTVHLALDATDVNHAFYVPKFLFNRDAIPGKENVFDFDVPAEFEGQSFHGQCAELCGPQHWAMQFSVKVLSPTDFDAWLKEQVASAQASPSPSGGGEAQGEVLELTAKNIAYDKTELTATADKPFVIRFTNDDASVAHNVAIHKDSPTGEEVWKGEIFQGVDSRNYAVPALPAGTYAFVCTVHPNMNGTLTVK
jgi:cytochrome c oxidase subunit 2